VSIRQPLATGPEPDMTELDVHAHDAHAHTHPDTTAVHGMLLFGDDVHYLSHLPMFMHPHNFQVLLEVAFDDATETALRTDRENGHEGYHTFKPERFPITELDPAGTVRTTLRGTVFRDHFERGGERIAAGATATIRQVVQYSELDIEAVPAAQPPLRYLAFGAGGHVHLVHLIGARPSFDHVLTARSDELAAPTGARVVRFDALDLADNRLAPGREVVGLRDGAASSTLVRFEIEREVYLEIGELE
jgi:hypothetical protein